MTLSRRDMITRTAAVTLGFSGLGAFVGCTQAQTSDILGPLIKDPKNILDLPEGFIYGVVSRTGDPMSDGRPTPGAPDGMAAFTTDNFNVVRLMRNHELGLEHITGNANSAKTTISAFFNDDTPDRSQVYDVMPNGQPYPGGVSAIDVNLKTLETTNAQMRLAGTTVNCAGGPTPWGTWLSCEEAFDSVGDAAERNHGYVFEVPVKGDGLIEPKPLTDMGRFVHEAAAVDSGTGIVYLTEDRRPAAGFYRYIPNVPTDLAAGGRLQALGILNAPGRSMRNDMADRKDPRVGVRDTLPVTWIDVPNVNPSKDTMAEDCIAKGAAIFTRLEGCWAGDDGIYFTSTNGGIINAGQIWRYMPSPYEGLPHENTAPGRIQLFAEPNNRAIAQKVDNITIAPWGGIAVCEDGDGPNRVHFVRKDGSLIPFARHNYKYKGDYSELTGGCFSPDGSTFFVNIQRPGITVAIQGPFEKLVEA